MGICYLFNKGYLFLNPLINLVMKSEGEQAFSIKIKLRFYFFCFLSIFHKTY